jgi:hypothetical protein
MKDLFIVLWIKQTEWIQEFMKEEKQKLPP